MSTSAILVEPTRDEARNGWTPESLTKFLRSFGEPEFHRELLLRARERERQAQDAVDQFRGSDEDLEAAPGKKQLKALEKALAQAKQETAEAAERLAREWPELFSGNR